MPDYKDRSDALNGRSSRRSIDVFHDVEIFHRAHFVATPNGVVGIDEWMGVHPDGTVIEVTCFIIAADDRRYERSYQRFFTPRGLTRLATRFMNEMIPST